ncbi:hypothetical protein PROFUN_05505 [Planoprotostelium fungivorum]|uniref:Uncharacterized protein n=1 Tax=Planoprotostelium fungivorum TaxID=1890364 RepID=A0A2P6NQZ0_9EUKA|nr:hypothetical protein PROFUN_05505 [Planoprotostelium fungivorum]
MLYLGWVRPYPVHHSLVRHSPAFLVEALERVSPLRPESNTFVYHLLCGRAKDIQFSARRQYWPYISRSFVGLTPGSSLVTSHRQLRDNSLCSSSRGEQKLLCDHCRLRGSLEVAGDTFLSALVQKRVLLKSVGAVKSLAFERML